MLNLFERDVVILGPETKLVTNATEIKTQQRKLYLCVALDLYDQDVGGGPCITGSTFRW